MLLSDRAQPGHNSGTFARHMAGNIPFNSVCADKHACGHIVTSCILWEIILSGKGFPDLRVIPRCVNEIMGWISAEPSFQDGLSWLVELCYLGSILF